METSMNGRIAGASRLLAVMGVVVGVLGGATASAGAKEAIYNNIVRPLPGNFASTGFEATSTAEYGGEVQFARTARKHPMVTVAMSSWACQTGNWSKETCLTPKPKKAFKWPLTLNIYSVYPNDQVGEKLGSVTKMFHLPYRPSDSRVCENPEFNDAGAWYDEATNECFHGKAFTVTFHLPAKLVLPPKAIISVAYNTSTYGASPQGTQPCDATSAGCFYDSLNVADIEPAENGLSLGLDPTESQFVNSNYNAMFCGSNASLNTFGPTGSCPSFWEGDQPAFEVQAG
jgi:hypothetical protein